MLTNGREKKESIASDYTDVSIVILMSLNLARINVSSLLVNYAKFKLK